MATGQLNKAKLIGLLIIVFIFSLGSPVMAEMVDHEINALTQLKNANTLKCTQNKGYQWSFDGEKLKGDKADFSSDEVSYVTFAKVDFKNRKALLVGNAGTEDIQAFLTPVGIHFIEITPNGGLNTSTVFSHRDSVGLFFYTTSRHVQLSGIGKPITMPSQYTGTCQILE